MRRFSQLALLVSVTSGGAFAQDVPALVFAQGLSSCANWTSDPVSELGAQSWILGYWSGLNQTNPTGHFVGINTDGAGVVAAVRKACRDDPSANLAITTLRTYRSLQAKNR